MQDEDDLTTVIKMAKTIGMLPEYVQGAGGNISFKGPDGKMLIKASGLDMSNISSSFGLVAVNYLDIASALTSGNEDANRIDHLITLNSPSSNLRASMETGFHTILDRFVLHTHSVYLNVLLCSYEGEEILAELLPEASFIEYCTPGSELAYRVLRARTEQVYLLQNHGIIVHSNDANEVLNMHHSVNQLLIRKFSLPPLWEENTEPLVNTKHIYFPDHAVYMNSNKSMETQSSQILMRCSQYIAEQQERLKLTPKFLSEEEIKMIINLGAEKYRMGRIS